MGDNREMWGGLEGLCDDFMTRLDGLVGGRVMIPTITYLRITLGNVMSILRPNVRR